MMRTSEAPGCGQRQPSREETVRLRKQSQARVLAVEHGLAHQSDGTQHERHRVLRTNRLLTGLDLMISYAGPAQIYLQPLRCSWKTAEGGLDRFCEHGAGV